MNSSGKSRVWLKRRATQGTTGADEPPIGRSLGQEYWSLVLTMYMGVAKVLFLIVFLSRPINAHLLHQYAIQRNWVGKMWCLYLDNMDFLTFWGKKRYKRVSTLVSVKPCHGLVISAAHQNTSNQTTGKGGPKTRARYVFTLRLGLCGWDNMVEN